MRGLVIFFVFLTFCQCLMASEFPNGIPGSEVPKMRSGFSQLLSNRDICNSISRRIVMGRFSETLPNMTPENTIKAINHLQEIMPDSNIATAITAAKNENIETLFSEMQQFLTQEIRPNITPALRNVPGECILSAGFTKNIQDPLLQAGCYIRLGQNLRSRNMKNLAATSFLKSGNLYANAALNDTSKNHTDLLLSTAQCYYWGYCNEQRTLRKERFKTLYTHYFECAHSHALLFNDMKMVTKIEQEKLK